MARNAGKEEIATFFKQVMSEDSQRAQRCHQSLSELTKDGTSATSPQDDSAGAR